METFEAKYNVNQVYPDCILDNVSNTIYAQILSCLYTRLQITTVPLLLPSDATVSSTWIDAANICPEMYLGTKKCSTIAAQKRARQAGSIAA